MEAIEQLEVLDLVSKITKEIENHTGLNDKVLAEFVISIHDQSNASLPEFKQKMKSVGAEFPDSFLESVDRLILSLHPKHKNKQFSPSRANPDILPEHEKKRRLLPGLALKDKPVPVPVPDDIFMAEIGDIVSGKKDRPPPSDDFRPPKRQRREQSPSPPRGRRDRRDDDWDRNSRPVLDDRPVIYKVYNGRVSGLKDFGAFVTLEGIAGRVEGK